LNKLPVNKKPRAKYGEPLQARLRPSKPNRSHTPYAPVKRPHTAAHASMKTYVVYTVNKPLYYVLRAKNRKMEKGIEFFTETEYICEETLEEVPLMEDRLIRKGYKKVTPEEFFKTRG